MSGEVVQDRAEPNGNEAMDTNERRDDQAGPNTDDQAGPDTDHQIDLNTVQDALQSAAQKWYALGLQLELGSTSLHEVELEKGKEPSYYLNGMLRVWMEREDPRPSWSAVIEALKKNDETELVNRLQEKYGGCDEKGNEKSEEEGNEKSEEEGGGETEIPVNQVPDYKTQKQELQAVLQQRLRKGDTWFLIDVKWLKQWKKYVGYDQWDQYHVGQVSANPGQIDNANLFKDANSDALREHLMEELDYSLLPEAAWNKLTAWYGLSQGSRPINRKVVEHGLYMKHCKVEVYLLEFKLCLHPKLNEPVNMTFSRAETIADLEAKLRSVFDVEKDAQCRVWHRYMTSTYELLPDPKQSLQDAGLYNGQMIVLEQKNKDGSWPRATEKSAYGTRSSDSSSSYGSSSHHTSSFSSSSSYYCGWGSHQKPAAQGLCGLNNLGNMCFMNSALQCLSNTQPLTEYFLGTLAGYKPYMKHLNKSNPDGAGGAIAESYGSLLEEMWNGKFSCVAPRHFKTQVGRYAPKFVGYAQHDSQELLAFLLNSLHEDLNLVRLKPYVDMTVKTKGRADNDIAEESWHKYLQRNQSVIVRVFQGQLKSTLVCPACKLVSKIFDPFMFLSLPLPIKKTRTLIVTLVRTDPAAELYRYKLKVAKRGCVNDLKSELAKLTDISTDKMVVVDVYNSRFHRIYDDRETLSHVYDRDDIFIYELGCLLNDPDWVHVPVYHREEIVREVKYTYQSYSQRYHQLFALPLIVKVPRVGCTYRILYSTITTWCRRYVKTQAGGEAAREQGEDEDLFRLVVVNSYGSQEVQRPKDDDSIPLKLDNQTYIACEWQTDVKDKCFDVQRATDIQDDASYNKVEEESRRSIHLMDCMRLFTEKETLGKDDAWCCPECNEVVQASRKFDLWKLPDILVIHLKRFSYDRYWRDKLDALVEFPVNGLDLSEFSQNMDDPQPIYDLYAVSNHFGGMGGGHYTAYCKNKETGKWYNFDDSHVSEASESQLVTAAAYVLFYRRRTEGRPTHILDRSLSQSFADEVRVQKAKFRPSSESAPEEEEMQCEEEGGGQERKRSRNESGSGDDVFPGDSAAAASSMEEPD